MLFLPSDKIFKFSARKCGKSAVYHSERVVAKMHSQKSNKQTKSDYNVRIEKEDMHVYLFYIYFYVSIFNKRDRKSVSEVVIKYAPS